MSEHNQQLCVGLLVFGTLSCSTSMWGAELRDDEGRGNHAHEKSLDSTHDSIVLIIITTCAVVGFQCSHHDCLLLIER
jgi:hypothetical protein